MDVTIVIAVPRIDGGAFLATNVDSKGESAITTIPQKHRKEIMIITDDVSKTRGIIIQQIPEHRSA